MARELPRRCATRPRASYRLRLEALEDRVLPATRTWTGLAADSHWTSAANWDGGVTAPAAGDTLVFPEGAPRSSNVNDFPVDTAFGTITLGPGYTITGHEIMLSGGITFQPASSLFSLLPDSVGLNMVLASDAQLVFADSPSSPYLSGADISGSIQLAGHDLLVHVFGNPSQTGPSISLSGSITGDGQVRVGGAPRPVSFSGHNTYTGATDVFADGWLKAVTSDALGSPNVGASVEAGSLLEVAVGGAASLAEPLTIAGTGPGLPELAPTAGAVSVSAGSSTRLTGPITLAADSALGVTGNNAATATLGSAIDTNGHTLTLRGPLTALLDGATINGGGQVNQAGAGVLGGHGTIASPLFVDAGTLGPGVGGAGSADVLSTGDAAFAAGTAYQVNLGSAGSSTLQARAVDLGLGPTLHVAVDPSFVSKRGQKFTLVQSSSGITGHFRDENGNELVDGSTVTAGGHTFIIRYLSGTFPHDHGRSPGGRRAPVERVVLVSGSTASLDAMPTGTRLPLNQEPVAATIEGMLASGSSTSSAAGQVNPVSLLPVARTPAAVGTSRHDVVNLVEQLAPWLAEVLAELSR